MRSIQSNRSNALALSNSCACVCQNNCWGSKLAGQTSSQAPQRIQGSSVGACNGISDSLDTGRGLTGKTGSWRTWNHLAEHDRCLNKKQQQLEIFFRGRSDGLCENGMPTFSMCRAPRYYFAFCCRFCFSVLTDIPARPYRTRGWKTSQKSRTCNGEHKTIQIDKQSLPLAWSTWESLWVS